MNKIRREKKISKQKRKTTVQNEVMRVIGADWNQNNLQTNKQTENK